MSVIQGPIVVTVEGGIVRCVYDKDGRDIYGVDDDQVHVVDLDREDNDPIDNATWAIETIAALKQDGISIATDLASQLKGYVMEVVD